MRETVKKIFEQWLCKRKTLNCKHKFLIIANSVVVIAAISITVFVISVPNMVTLLTGSTPKSMVEVSYALTDSGIKNEISYDLSSVSVPKNMLFQAKTVLVTEGIPQEAFNFADVVGSISMGTTAETQKMINLELTKSKLEKELCTWDDIENVAILLTAEVGDTLFVPQQKGTTASIVLETTGDFTDATAKSVANYVKGCISGLEELSIVVIGNNGEKLYNGEE